MQTGLEPRRSLGLAMTTSMVVGNMVGSGVFLLPAVLAVYGTYSLWGWMLSTTGALALAWVFSDLSRRSPQAGGPYAYSRDAFGDFAGFLVAWMYWISIAAAVAAISVAFASYLVPLIPAISTQPLAGAGVALLASWLLTGINIWGIRTAGRLQLITVVLKLSPLLVLALFGSFYFNPHLLASRESAGSPFKAIDACAALTMWAFLGLECGTIPADHVKDPNRTIPRATLIATIVAAVFYIVCTTAVMGIIPAQTLAHSNAPFADAARLLWGGWAGDVIALTGAISCFGALNGWILMSGQFAQAVARDNLFPKLFARELPRGTPASGLVVSSAFGTVLIVMSYSSGLVNTFKIAILIATLFTLVPYMLCSMAQILFSGRSRRDIRGIVLSLLAFAFSLWAAAGTGKDSLYWGTLVILAGIPVYVWQKRSPPARAEPSSCR